MNIAIITGASSGMGREFVLQIDKSELIDEIWVIARRENRLKELSGLTKAKLRPLAMDLKDQQSIDTLAGLLNQLKPKVEILVNAAGFGKFGSFSDLNAEEYRDMIGLNINALLDMTRICIPYMSHGSRIIQLCSSSAFQPLPGFNIYASTKSFIYHFSLALHAELKSQAITVTAACPGWVDTEFFTVAENTKNAGAVSNFPFLAQAPSVVAKALRDSRRGKSTSVYGAASKMQRVMCKLLPFSLVMAVWNRIRK